MCIWWVLHCRVLVLLPSMKSGLFSTWRPKMLAKMLGNVHVYMYHSARKKIDRISFWKFFVEGFLSAWCYCVLCEEQITCFSWKLHVNCFVFSNLDEIYVNTWTYNCEETKAYYVQMCSDHLLCVLFFCLSKWYAMIWFKKQYFSPSQKSLVYIYV